jgi:ubiquinone/menaquinone biosynthesis C-methylase UbiE
MNRTPPADFVVVERERMRLEYQRREREIVSDVYAPWQTAFRFMADERNRMAASMLHQAAVFPRTGDQCLEVGFGAAGWLSELIGWGIRESDLHGIDLDPERARKTRELLPATDLRDGDAVALPWCDGSMHLVIASTLFTSILDPDVRQLIADEIVRVLAPGGALLWYDFAYNNPRNRNVRGIGRSEIRRLFPTLQGRIRSVTLAPPLSRLIAPRCWPLAAILAAIPPLRTHLLGVLARSA